MAKKPCKSNFAEVVIEDLKTLFAADSNAAVREAGVYFPAFGKFMQRNLRRMNQAGAFTCALAQCTR